MYTYDGQGRRVRRKLVDGSVTTYIYGGAGELVAEYGEQSGTVGTVYVTGDFLGSTRLLTDAEGAVTGCQDYLPFGELVPANTSARTGISCYSSDAGVRQKFTGKERDGETGLDYFGARYFSAAQGRFTSPDRPFADQDPLDPQSWNLYGYGRNNPLANIDPSGRSCITTTTPDGKTQQGDNGDGKGCAAAGVAPTTNQQPPTEQDISDITPHTINVDSSSAPVPGSPEDIRQTDRDVQYVLHDLKRFRNSQLPEPGPKLEGPARPKPRPHVDAEACEGAAEFFLENPDIYLGQPSKPTDPQLGNDPGSYYMPSGRTRNGGQVAYAGQPQPALSGVLWVISHQAAVARCKAALRGAQ